MEGITCIKEDEIVTSRLVQSLVHRVIESMVGFRLDDDGVGYLLLICFCHLDGVILRGTVDNQVLNVLARLSADTVERPLQDGSRLVSNSNNGYSHCS